MGVFKYTIDQLNKLIDRIYAGQVTPRNLPVDLYIVTVNRLMDAVKRGMGGSSSNFSDGSPDFILSKHYEHNIAIFSGAKVHQQVVDMSNLIFDEQGYKRPFSEFKKMITGDDFYEGVFSKYNVQYLETEYNTAFRTAQMGSQWNAYVNDSDVLPYLKYVTAHDERVRHSHQAFDGVTLPVGHSFWNTHIPPNGFNCRCRMVQMSEHDDDLLLTTNDQLKTMPPPDSDLFAFNPGKNDFIFDPSKHPYTARINERYTNDFKNNFGLPTPVKPTTPIARVKIIKPKKK